MTLPRRAFLVGSAVLATTRIARADALAKFTTTYQTDAEHKSRAANVQLAAEAIDGKKIAPGATFSFNDAVGERTAAFGFEKAQVLRDGMLAEGMGGGACQVASTLHAAAQLAGLDIAARAPHSRPSAYIRMGLDATVAYPKIDLKLANHGADEVVIRARAANGTLDITIEGKTKPAVTLTSEILDHTDPARTFDRDVAANPNEAVRTQFGIPGYRVKCTRVVTTPDGAEHRDTRTVEYAPVPEIIRVAPSFDTTRLAPPSDEASESDARVKITNAATALRPLTVQLHPSALVTLSN